MDRETPDRIRITAKITGLPPVTLITESGWTATPVHFFVMWLSRMDLPINQIICGDNCDVLGTLPRDCIDLVVTSPPYDDLRTYGGHDWDFYGVAWQLKRVLKPGGVIVWVVGDATKDGSETGSSMLQALHFQTLGMRLHDTMIYCSDKPPLNSNRYEHAWEYMIVATKGKPKTFNKLTRKTLHGGKQNTSRRYFRGNGELKEMSKPGTYNETATLPNVWWYATGLEKTGHPAVFPAKLATDHILSWSNEGDIVLDPFSGSGTTAKMAKHNGRKYIGIEVNAEYCEIAKTRLAQGVLDFAT